MSQTNWNKLAEAVEKLLADATILQYEYDMAKPVVCNKKEIRFNGIGDDGHETFLLKRNNKVADYLTDKSMAFAFCKTACKPYDVYVTAVLTLAKYFLGKEIKLGSDGNVSDWQDGCQLIREKLNMYIGMEENPMLNSQCVEDAIIKKDTKYAFEKS